MIKVSKTNKELDQAQERVIKASQKAKKMTSKTVEDAYANIFGTATSTSTTKTEEK